MPSHCRRRLLHPQGRRARSRRRPGNPARPAWAQLADEHAHDDRAVHAVRKAGLHPHGARLMAALKGKALIAYLVVCVFWGSTYLAIKVGVTELPPFLFAGLRFLVAGLVPLPLAPAPGDPSPRRGDSGTLTIAGLPRLAACHAVAGWLV